MNYSANESRTAEDSPVPRVEREFRDAVGRGSKRAMIENQPYELTLIYHSEKPYGLQLSAAANIEERGDEI